MKTWLLDESSLIPSLEKQSNRIHWLPGLRTATTTHNSSTSQPVSTTSAAPMTELLSLSRYSLHSATSGTMTCTWSKKRNLQSRITLAKVVTASRLTVSMLSYWQRHRLRVRDQWFLIIKCIKWLVVLTKSIKLSPVSANMEMFTWTPFACKIQNSQYKRVLSL